MSVSNGQIANQTTFNNAFMSRTAPTTQTKAQVALENDEVESGAYVENAQRAINKAFEAVGATGEDDATVNDYANENYITNGDNRKQAVEKLDAQLKLTQDDLDTAETTIVDHEGRIAAAESTLTNHEGRIVAEEAATVDHEGRLDNLESNDMTIGGNKTFSGDVVIAGDLEVQGTVTSINSDNLEVEDQNITVNKNGTDGSSEGAGIDIERVTENAAIRFDSTLASKFKIGLLSALREIVVSGVAQTVSGIKDFVSGLKVDTINESTLDSGVTVDSVLIKDGLVDGRDVSVDGSTLDGHTSTLSNHEGRITTLESDVGTLQTDVTALQGTVGNHETRIADIETGNNTFGGNKTFSGDVDLQASTLTKDLKISDQLFVGSVTNTQTGADVELTGITAPLVKLTGAGLASIDRIVAPSDVKMIMLLNQTGADVFIKDNVGSPSANRIRTGLNADVQLNNNGIAFLMYDTAAALWYLTATPTAAGGGGGAGGSKTFDMKLNGLYGGADPYNGVDGLWVAPSNIQITNVFIYQETPGASGTTELDLKVKPFASGSFTSLFLTTPKITNLAAANDWGGVGDTVTGITAPILSSLPYAVAAKSALRMDLISSQLGGAAGVGLIIVYEEL